MDPSVINALICDYLSAKDKILAETVKTKLKAVSITFYFTQKSSFKIFTCSATLLARTHFLKYVEKTT